MRLILLVLLPIGLLAQEQRFESLMKKHPQFNGVVLLADKGKIQFEKAYGYRTYADKTPLQTTDIFELASVSKQFTAMIIMMLKDRGQLQFDDPVSKYLTIPYGGITIRHLLTHTSGLPDYQEIMDQHWDKSKVAGNKEILEYLNMYAPPKEFEPGTKYNYSNTGYVILASIAEKASGKDFIKLCREWIFTPFGMTSTNIRTLSEKAAVRNFAIGHVYVKERNDFIRADSFPSSNYTIWLGNRKGPGRISSTAQDLFKWDRALYSAKLVKPETLEEAFSAMRLKDGSFHPYGFGWDLPDNTYYGKIVMHNGDNPGYHTQIIRNIGRDKTIIVLSNNAYAHFNELLKDLQEELFQR